VLAEADDGHRVQLVGLEPRVDDDDPRARAQQVVGDGLDQGQGDPLDDRSVGRLARSSLGLIDFGTADRHTHENSQLEATGAGAVRPEDTLGG
jgi:hypothetical protein